MNQTIQRRQTGKQGFSLVEVALALLVVAIGFTAIFGLFPAGMQASRTAIEETEMSEFADFVFASLDVLAMRNWSDLDDDELGGNANWRIRSTRIMGTSPSPEQLLRTAPPDRPVLFTWTPTAMGFDVTHFTYSLMLEPVAGTGGNMRRARLQVWPGLRDQAVVAAANATPSRVLPGSIVFYREYRRPN